jgi:L-2,4-diaminobutyric acid acetyltransferase
MPADTAIRPPRLADAAAVWTLVRDSGRLDLNSPYCYLLLCRDFTATSAVAEADGGVVGFVTAYRLPDRPDTLFVWQIGVAAPYRGRGVAGRLLDDLLVRPACAGVTHVETTIGPSNQASRALFEALARRRGARMTEAGGLPPGLFPDAGHEPELRFRIGPLAEAVHSHTPAPPRGGETERHERHAHL